MITINPNYENWYNLIETLEQFNRATDVILNEKIRYNVGLALFIDESGEIESVSEYDIRRRITTKRKIIRFKNHIKLDNKITKKELLEHFKKHRSRINGLFNSYSITQPTPKTAADIIDYIKEKNKNIQLFKKKKIRTSYYNYQNVELEGDAIKLPLKIAGIDDVEYRTENPQKNLSLFENIVNENLIEDQMIGNDFNHFMEKEEWTPQKYKVNKFYNHKTGKIVTVFYTNRTKIENLIGVDLVIYNSIHKSYIFIQYKRMIKENEGYIYRMDKQFEDEIKRMNLLRMKLLAESRNRLKNDPFYLKFCPSKQNMYVGNETKLTKGIILPLDNYEYLLENNFLKTPRKADILTYDNVDKYIDNTLFITLYKEGWIGSDKFEKEVIEGYTQNALNGDRSVIMAFIK